MPAHAQTTTAAIMAAGRHLLEERGMEALTMRDVASAVGVRAPSLYKRIRDRSDLVRLILEDVADELTSTLDAAAGRGDPAADARAMASAYRKFAHANPVTYSLMFTAQAGAPGGMARSIRASATFLRTIAELAGPDRALPAARLIVAWAHGFIVMELAGAFLLGGDVEEAWDFGLDRILTAVRCAGEVRLLSRAGRRDGCCRRSRRRWHPAGPRRGR